jgi:hypothetical protein
MSRTTGTHIIVTLAVLCIGVALSATGAIAAGKTNIDKGRLVGSWTLVGINNTTPDGKTVQTYGPNDGVLVFEANGGFVQILARSDLPKFASNNRNTGSADENKAVVQGSLAIYGKYTINAKDGALTLHIDRSSYPNWNGADQKRIVTSLTANELKWEIPAPSVGGASVAVWKRNK